MENNDKEFENYLAEFEPRKPRALPELVVHRKVWRQRLAAPAAMAIFLGASLWFARRKSELNKGGRVTTNPTSMAATKSPASPLALLPCTRLALQDPEQFDAQLTEASLRVLPDFQRSNSTLRVLAKE